MGRVSLHAEGPDGPALLESSKSLGICAVLATRSDHAATRAELAGLLWPDLDRRKGRRALRQALHYLRSKAGAKVVRRKGERLELDTDKLRVDLSKLESALRSGDHSRAVALYAGRFLNGLEVARGREFEELVESRDAYIRAGVRAAYAQLIQDRIAGGEAQEAVRLALRYVELNPLDESAQIALLQSLKASGDPLAALQAYRSYESLLKAALDEEPSSDLEGLGAAVEAALHGAPAAAPPPRAPTVSAARSPWLWLATGSAVGALAASALLALLFAL